MRLGARSIYVVVALLLLLYVYSDRSNHQKLPSCVNKCEPYPDKFKELAQLDNVGVPTLFVSPEDFKCNGDNELGELLTKRLPADIDKQMYPEGKVRLKPFPAPALVRKWQLSVLDPSSDPMPKCDHFGICECPGDAHLFDGRKCIDRASTWGDDPYIALRNRWAKAPLKVQADDISADEAEADPAAYARKWEKDAMFSDAWTLTLAGSLVGKQVLDVGAGYARQSFVCALHGAYVTHLDVVPDNLRRIRVLAKHYGIEHRVNTVYLDTLESAKEGLKGKVFDTVLFFGSMHHMPREYIIEEVKVYFNHMRVGSRLIQLAYPSSRWFCYNGGLTFPEFCASTDHNCPWAEWYDTEKFLATFAPRKFAVQYSGIVGPNEFSWHEMVLLN